jgi:hypothetical protein
LCEKPLSTKLDVVRISLHSHPEDLQLIIVPRSTKSSTPRSATPMSKLCAASPAASTRHMSTPTT